MRTNPTCRTIRWTLAASLLAVAACGDDSSTDDASATTTTTTSEAATSDYCHQSIEWAIHELKPFDDTDPTAFRAYWDEYLAFRGASIAAAPAEIKSDWDLKVSAEEAAGITAILEKYDFDVAVMEEFSTPEEQAAFEAPADAMAAQDRIQTYDNEVCGSRQPVAAHVSYAGEEPGPYCELVAAQNEQASAALASGDPAKIEAETDALEANAAAVTEAAPDVIKDDVAALAAWTNGPQRAVFERFGYDLATAMRQGTAQDRADLNQGDPDIRDHFARVAAYELQVCGG
jgi:hypothetical protein